MKLTLKMIISRISCSDVMFLNQKKSFGAFILIFFFFKVEIERFRSVAEMLRSRRDGESSTSLSFYLEL